MCSRLNKCVSVRLTIRVFVFVKVCEVVHVCVCIREDKCCVMLCVY